MQVKKSPFKKLFSLDAALKYLVIYGHYDYRASPYFEKESDIYKAHSGFEIDNF